MLNNVSLVGRLTKDPEVKVIGQGTAVCNFTLAVNRNFKNDAGEVEADFIQCQAWKGQAEFIGSYLKKGNLISLTGSINTRTYEKDGITRYITEVNVNNVQSLESKKSDTPQLNTVGEVKAAWTAEWDQRSVGLDAASKENLKKELAAKYQPQIDKLEQKTDLPF